MTSIKTLRRRLEEIVEKVVADLYGLDLKVRFSPPRDPKFGDYATNVAFQLASSLKQNPSAIAEELASELREPLAPIAELETVGGFVNLRIRQPVLRKIVFDIVHRHGDDYGMNETGDGQRVLVEFVSANPTGPLNVANARAAAVGDSIVRIMNFSGYVAHSEYLVNDAGGQIRALGESVAWRLGERETPPQDGYLGDYLVEIARKIKESGAKRDEYGFKAADLIFQMQLTTLERFRVKYDSIVREREVRKSGLIDKVLKILDEKGVLSKVRDLPQDLRSEFKDIDALVLRADFFDPSEKPRVLLRSNGEPTYFLIDLAYHLGKFERGYQWVINLWGPDHHGYIPRMRAGLEAMGLLENGKFDVLIVQQVNLIRNGERVRMSKRRGEFFTMDELIDEVGVDAARFFFLMRSANAHLDFDLDLAKKLGSENPVFYVQYAHARVVSLHEHAEKEGVKIEQADLNKLDLPEERELMRQILYFPDVVGNAAKRLEPHNIPHYLLALASEFHNYYQKHRILTEDKGQAAARLTLSEAIRVVVKNGLRLIGVSAPEHM